MGISGGTVGNPKNNSLLAKPGKMQNVSKLAKPPTDSQ